MSGIFRERTRQGYRTLRYPYVDPSLSDRYLGLPRIAKHDCGGCHACLDICPTHALSFGSDGIRLDMGRCLFCGKCAAVCGANVITFTDNHRVVRFSREDLIVSASNSELAKPNEEFKMFSRSLKLRVVSAGGCNACEADTNVLGTLVYDLGKFGIDYVASPRHADGLVVIGPVPTNMMHGMLDTYEAMPDPKLVIAVGCCAISGGLFRDGGDNCMGLDGIIPVSAYVPGCPPNPWSILHSFLAVSWRKNDNS